jgi:hypothetical protein
MATLPRYTEFFPPQALKRWGFVVGVGLAMTGNRFVDLPGHLSRFPTNAEESWNRLMVIRTIAITSKNPFARFDIRIFPYCFPQLQR